MEELDSIRFRLEVFCFKAAYLLEAGTDLRIVWAFCCLSKDAKLANEVLRQLVDALFPLLCFLTSATHHPTHLL